MFEKATFLIGSDVPFKFSAFVFFGEMLRSGITGSYGSLIFHFFEEPPYCFQ